jgi:hypothetical protein
MKPRCVVSQPNLFCPHHSIPQPRVPELIALMPLVRNLLLEVLSKATATTPRSEDGNEQDYG